MNVRLNELNHTEGKLNHDEHDSKRNFVALPSAPSAEKTSQNPDEISIQLSFRFVCGNSFKVLIGLGLCFALGWNVYNMLSSRNPPSTSQVPALPQQPLAPVR
jgi:hypothetical protein